MQNMRKLKEDALRRKHEFEEKQRQEELRKQRKTTGGRPRSRSDRRGSSKGRTQDARQQQPAPLQKKKSRRTPARWVLDILLVLGTLIVLVMMFNPY